MKKSPKEYESVLFNVKIAKTTLNTLKYNEIFNTIKNHFSTQILNKCNVILKKYLESNKFQMAKTELENFKTQIHKINELIDFDI